MRVQCLFCSKICQSAPDMSVPTSKAASSKLGGCLNIALQAKALEPFEINLSQIKQPHEKSFTAQTGTQINLRDLPR